MSTDYFLGEEFFGLIGVAGFLLYMLSYALLQLGRISGHGYSYTVLNMLAATFVLISLLHQFNLASALIQISWIIISLIGIFRLWSSNRRRKSRRRLRFKPKAIIASSKYSQSKSFNL